MRTPSPCCQSFVFYCMYICMCGYFNFSVDFQWITADSKEIVKCAIYEIHIHVCYIFCRYFQLSYVRYFSILSPICWCCCHCRCRCFFSHISIAIIVAFSLSARSDNQFNCNSSSLLRCVSSALHGRRLTVDCCQLLSIVSWLLTVLCSDVVFVYAVYESLCQLLCLYSDIYVYMRACVYLCTFIMAVSSSVNKLFGMCANSLSLCVGSVRRWVQLLAYL